MSTTETPAADAGAQLTDGFCVAVMARIAKTGESGERATRPHRAGARLKARRRQGVRR